MRSVWYCDLRLVASNQDYFTPHVGVVSLSTDPPVPTMCAHYSTRKWLPGTNR